MKAIFGAKPVKTTPPQPLTPLAERAAEVAATIADKAQRALFERAVGRIDPLAHAALQEKHRAATLRHKPTYIYKYLDVSYWLKDKIAKVFSLGLARTPGLRILDLGTGVGHFPALCNALGHETIGVDLKSPFYEEMCALMGVDRRTLRVEPKTPLPDSLGTFDLITGFAVKFDARGVDIDGRHLYWSLADWDYFIGDVTGARLRHPGRLYLALNSRVLPNGGREHFTDVIEACRGAGASILPNDEILFEANTRLSLPV